MEGQVIPIKNKMSAARIPLKVTFFYTDDCIFFYIC
jgi:hypothetical protein